MVSLFAILWRWDPMPPMNLHAPFVDASCHTIVFHSPSHTPCPSRCLSTNRACGCWAVLGPFASGALRLSSPTIDTCCGRHLRPRPTRWPHEGPRAAVSRLGALDRVESVATCQYGFGPQEEAVTLPSNVSSGLPRLAIYRSGEQAGHNCYPLGEPPTTDPTFEHGCPSEWQSGGKQHTIK
jgi:hypothetical protein